MIITTTDAPAEYRDERFAYLEQLIRAGYGNVPQPAIERLKRRNGGVLPPAPAWAAAIPEGDPEPTPRVSWRVPALDAVAAGHTTAVAVARVVGITRQQATDALRTLVREGKVEVCGSTRADSGQKMFVYRRIERKERAA